MQETFENSDAGIYTPDPDRDQIAYSLLGTGIEPDATGLYPALDHHRYPTLLEAQLVDMQVLHRLYGASVNTREEALHRGI